MRLTPRAVVIAVRADGSSQAAGRLEPADLERRAGGVGARLGMIEDGAEEAAVLRGGRGRVAQRRAEADERAFDERPRVRFCR